MKNDECQVRIVEPYTITFHNGAYYMVAYIHGKGYSNPAHYRLDKIKEIKTLKEKFQINHDETWITAEVEVLGTEGIVYWILSQKDRVEVLAPQSLRNQMIETLERMRQQYRGNGEERP